MVKAGMVTTVIYSNEKHWNIFVINDNGSNLKIAGVIENLAVGDYIEADGEMEKDNYDGGQILKAVAICQKMPNDVKYYVSYLTKCIDGVGVVTARTIVDAFGEKTFDVLCDEPEKVAQLPRISINKAYDISMQVKEKTMSQNDQLFFIKLGMKQSVIEKAQKKYGAKTKEVIQRNPYQLINDISGVGFKMADQIARNLGIPNTSPFRIVSGIEYVLNNAANAGGNSYLPKNILIKRVISILGLRWGMIEPCITKGVEEDVFVNDDGKIYLKKYYDMEIKTAETLVDLNDYSPSYVDNLEKKIIAIEKQKGVQLDSIQRGAVMHAVRNKISIITGGPGTGKTTVLDVLITYLEQYENEENGIVLMAPTGKAAKRMTEQTGMAAGTIHRTVLSTASREVLSEFIEDEIGEEPHNNIQSDERDGELHANTIIVDEMSMINMVLFRMLLSIVKKGTRLVLVGDINQLPSIGVGQVLKDLINSGAVRVTMLKNIYRQAAESNIIQNAHRINEKKPIDLRTKHNDFFFMTQKKESFDIFVKTMKRLIEAIPHQFPGVTPFDVQILCPQRKEQAGINNLNRIVQEYLNPPSPQKHEYVGKDGVVLREGDKVIHCKNNYDLEWIIKENGRLISNGIGVFNGEIGFIQKINPDEKTMTVLYDDERLAMYNKQDISEIELAYAMTIHKSQGSEYPAVIIPLLTKGVDTLYNKNLLYTAVTRAKNCVAILGEGEIVNYMINNTSMEMRYTTLASRIKELIP